jgi:Uma2 family endonuclease
MSIPMRIPEGKIVLTYDDYVELPNDGNRYEILEGELAVTPAPNLKHQISSANVFKIVSRHVDDNKLGITLYAPLDLILESTSVLQPDLLFVSQARRNILTDKGIVGAPDLVVEILSPTTTRNDRVNKAQIYARHKVPAYWIVDPEQETLEIYLLDADSYRLAATLRGESPLPVPPFTELKFGAKDIFI